MRASSPLLLSTCTKGSSVRFQPIDQCCIRFLIVWYSFIILSNFMKSYSIGQNTPTNGRTRLALVRLISNVYIWMCVCTFFLLLYICVLNPFFSKFSFFNSDLRPFFNLNLVSGAVWTENIYRPKKKIERRPNTQTHSYTYPVYQSSDHFLTLRLNDAKQQ